VAMCVNDLICTGGRPLGFLDYLAVGRLDPAEARNLVAGIAAACEAVGCALLGGETAEHPGVVPADHLDLAGFAVGVVERDEMLGPSRVQAGDVVVGLASSGLHANGFSLVRALVDEGRLAADPDVLLPPTRLYVDHMSRLRDAGIAVHAAAHITGGGLPGNLPRAMPPGLRPVLRPDAWPMPRAVGAVLATGAIDDDEAWATFNMGLGMCLVLPQTSVSAACALLDDAHVVGWVEAGGPGLRLDGAGG